jgi:hypothetical protein
MSDLSVSDVASPRVLPERPNLEHLKNEAKSRLKQLRATDPNALLADAQRELARSYGFSSWRKLRSQIVGPIESHASASDEGRVARLRWEQSLPRKEAVIDPGTLDRFVGTYRLTPLILTVVKEGDGLIAQLSGQAFLALVPESASKFFYRNPSIHAQLSFVVHGSEQASSAILHQNGREQTAHRITEAEVRRFESRVERRRKSNTPHPASENALRRLIETMRTGVPDRNLMDDYLSDLFDQQRIDNIRLSNYWGDVLNVKFIGVSQGNDEDVYLVNYASADVEWRISMTGSDKVRLASSRLYP